MTNNKTSKWYQRLMHSITHLISQLFGRSVRDNGEQRYQETKEVLSTPEVEVPVPIEIEEPEIENQRLKLESDEGAKPSEEDIGKVSRETEKQFRSEPHTSNKAFRMPILQALINLGGRAERKIVFDELEKIMGYKLTENDRKPLPSNKKLLRWQKIAGHARTDLLNDGYISVDPKKGMWMITEKGRKELEEWNK
jgi:hypothetical protein